MRRRTTKPATGPKPRATTVNQLYRKARKDRKFFDALLRNPRAAIRDQNLSLNEKDLRRLERARNEMYAFKGTDLAKHLVKGRVIIQPWPALGYKQWPGLKARQWP
jgi:hypothetical protein